MLQMLQITNIICSIDEEVTAPAAHSIVTTAAAHGICMFVYYIVIATVL